MLIHVVHIYHSYNKESYIYVYHDIYYDVLEHNIDEKVTWAKNKEMSPWAKVYLGKCLLGQQSLGLKSNLG